MVVRACAFRNLRYVLVVCEWTAAFSPSPNKMIENDGVVL